jgi:hypothetical protein
MPSYDENITTKPLNAVEMKWCSDVEKLFAKVPSRFGLFITGMDSDIRVFDRDELKKRNIELQDHSASDADLNLATIETKTAIFGLCG